MSPVSSHVPSAYAKRAAGLAGESCPATVTRTCTVPVVAAGAVASIRVGETTVKSVAGAAPKVTCVAALKPVPRIVTFAPPSVEPERGSSRVTSGSPGSPSATFTRKPSVLPPGPPKPGCTPPSVGSSPLANRMDCPARYALPAASVATAAPLSLLLPPTIDECTSDVPPVDSLLRNASPLPARRATGSCTGKSPADVEPATWALPP